MKLRAHAGLGLALAVALFTDAAVDATCQLLQDVEKRARAALVMRAQPASDADSIGFFAKDAAVLVSTCAVSWCEVNTPMGKGFVPDSLLVDPPAQPVQVQTRPAPAPPPRRACCRICRTGKACGDSCIARNRTCRVGVGCACNGGALLRPSSR